jgi:glyoxylase-like metal-dependent hydrolase (beta-lactamase superfamily II)
MHADPGPESTAPLSYPLEAKPEIGQTLDIAPGIKWLRLPLPFQLDHINVWLLRDGAGWALATHLHPDHVGCAANSDC